jgi:hypothetical protein
MKFAQERVDDTLDARFLIRKLLEIEKLKRLLLNEEQLKLFEYLPKPRIAMIRTNQVYHVEP